MVVEQLSCQPSCQLSKPPTATLPALAWKLYLKQLQQKPLRTKAFTSATIASLSDIIAQKVILRQEYSWRRTACIALLGGLWSGPSAHYWQKMMERLFRGKSDPTTVVRKTCVDQLVYGPTCTLVFMAYTSLVLQGRSWADTRSTLSSNFFSIQKNSWRLWPLVTLINYQFVPLQLRVLLLNVVSLCWSTFLLWRMRGLQAAQVAIKGR